MKITYSTVLVLEALARGYHYGFDIIDATNLPSGTVYPILRRFETEGLATSEWEAHSVATRDQRPPRRYYALTADGKKLLAETADRYRTAHEIVPRRPRALKPTRG
ncbi:MAG TPA: PadR family transcriptional regulator [Gammaproteobacteria bacterium]|nr:PadR family transcriptional regulator [Gammaproteobacteria bacterium]